MLLTEYDELEVMNLFRLEGKLEGLKEGKLEGLKELNSLYRELLREGRMDELQEAINDPVYLEELAKAFNQGNNREG